MTMHLHLSLSHFDYVACAKQDVIVSCISDPMVEYIIASDVTWLDFRLMHFWLVGNQPGVISIPHFAIGSCDVEGTCRSEH